MSELFVIANTLSIYISIQWLQIHYIQTGDHTDISPYSLIYNSLISVFIIRGLKYKVTPTWWYALLAHISAFSVAFLGEVSVFSVVLTDGVWKRSDLFMRVCLIIAGVIIFILMMYKLIKIRKYKQYIPLLCVIILWLYLWWILLSAGYKYSIHIHHAILAGFISFFFTEETKLDNILHAISIGCAVEGLDFYGIGELSLLVVSHEQQQIYHIYWILPPLIVLLSTLYCSGKKEEEEDDLSYELFTSVWRNTTNNNWHSDATSIQHV